MTLLLVGLFAAASVSAIGWAKARHDANEWARSFTTLGIEYDKLTTELARRGQPKMNIIEQRARWLN
jgi:hypothetical protein